MCLISFCFLGSKGLGSWLLRWCLLRVMSLSDDGSKVQSRKCERMDVDRYGRQAGRQHDVRADRRDRDRQAVVRDPFSLRVCLLSAPHRQTAAPSAITSQARTRSLSLTHMKDVQAQIDLQAQLEQLPQKKRTELNLDYRSSLHAAEVAILRKRSLPFSSCFLLLASCFLHLSSLHSPLSILSPRLPSLFPQCLPLLKTESPSASGSMDAST